jgi:hypothetical protein
MNYGLRDMGCEHPTFVSYIIANFIIKLKSKNPLSISLRLNKFDVRDDKESGLDICRFVDIS